jgi:hypothetical protein
VERLGVSGKSKYACSRRVGAQHASRPTEQSYQPSARRGTHAKDERRESCRCSCVFIPSRQPFSGPSHRVRQVIVHLVVQIVPKVVGPGGCAKKETPTRVFPASEPLCIAQGVAANVPKFPRRHRSNTTDSPHPLSLRVSSPAVSRPLPADPIVYPRLHSRRTTSTRQSPSCLRYDAPPHDTTSPLLRHTTLPCPLHMSNPSPLVTNNVSGA